MEDGAAGESRHSGQRPGPPRGDRAVVVPHEESQPPASWVPALLLSHLVVLGLAALVSGLLLAAGVRSGGYDDGRWTGSPAWVEPTSWAVCVATVVLVVRAVGRRRPGRLPYFLAGTASWAVLPLTWLVVAGSAAAPEGAVWYLLLYALSPYGWFFLVPALLLGACLTGVLARMNS